MPLGQVPTGPPRPLLCVSGHLEPFLSLSLLTVQVTIIKANELRLFPCTSGQEIAPLLPPLVLQPPVS